MHAIIFLILERNPIFLVIDNFQPAIEVRNLLVCAYARNVAEIYATVFTVAEEQYLWEGLVEETEDSYKIKMVRKLAWKNCFNTSGEPKLTL